MTASASTAASCRNCGQPLGGRFCQACGQSAVLPHTLADAAGELLRFLTHFDGRFWTTIAMLFRDPGRLSREWGQGRRTAYLPPVSMALFSALGFAALAAILIQADQGASPSNTWASVEAAGQLRTIVGRQLALLLPAALIGLDIAAPRRGRASFYGHAAMVFYAFSFIVLLGALLMIAVALLRFVLPNPPAGPALLILLGAAIVHVAVHLRGAYALSWPAAAVRTAVFLAAATAASLLPWLVLVALSRWLPFLNPLAGG